MILITLTFEEKIPNQNNINISIFKWGTFNCMACNVIIHKQYIYGLTIFRFCNDIDLLINLQNHNVKQLEWMYSMMHVKPIQNVCRV
jgi:hypothetical protein